MTHDKAMRFLQAPIQRELDDPSVREIVINRPAEIGVERGSGWTWRDVPEFSFRWLDALALRAARMTNREADAAHPLANSTLPDGQRIHICRPPATAAETIAIAIRRPPSAARKMADPDFLDLFTDTNDPVSKSTRFDAELASMLRNVKTDPRPFFRKAREARKTIDVVGPTGSGKTDYLKRMMQETADDSRVLTIEGDSEFGPIGPRNTVNLFFNEQNPALSAVNIVQTALRMRPDEVFFQECRGAEAWAVMRARAAGHRGGGTSWHAEEGKEIDALMLLMREHPPVTALPDERLRAICMRYLDIVVSCERTPSRDFKVSKIWMKGVSDA